MGAKYAAMPPAILPPGAGGQIFHCLSDMAIVRQLFPLRINNPRAAKYTLREVGGTNNISRLDCAERLLDLIISITKARMDEIRTFANSNTYYLIVRPNVEHNMLGVVMGRGGIEDLGATLWGQTELSCYDDSMHGIWGMSYKYHERAIVFNERNLIRLWDVAYDGYNGGKDLTHVDWRDAEDVTNFTEATHDLTIPYQGTHMHCEDRLHTHMLHASCIAHTSTLHVPHISYSDGVCRI